VSETAPGSEPWHCRLGVLYLPGIQELDQSSGMLIVSQTPSMEIGQRIQVPHIDFPWAECWRLASLQYDMRSDIQAACRYSEHNRFPCAVSARVLAGFARRHQGSAFRAVFLKCVPARARARQALCPGGGSELGIPGLATPNTTARFRRRTPSVPLVREQLPKRSKLRVLSG